MNRSMRLTCLTVLAAAVCLPAMASEPTMPEWDQLSAETRATLIAPIRERWNSQPDGRERMLQRAQRWSEMTPEQRGKARHGMDRWHHMSPAQRLEARALYSKMRGMNPDARKSLREQWRNMTPEQRKAWVEANPAPDSGERPR
ncbi:DUF3106 domain-containing protein [Lysobacter sp. H21R4]|uniref:DUF3106 domain-containing protein n=1 Tax=Lysobacter sp. H21R4 TaxID=2781021 RepID=UPI001887BA18|nr:DUF3106 domain-containing protein [Lysobacter sp. H21R4]QOY62294.1 DUF3106 domain-containing protein [Lysobacter sp. H21R4]